jgi:hypothetical protein
MSDDLPADRWSLNAPTSSISRLAEHTPPKKWTAWSEVESVYQEAVMGRLIAIYTDLARAQSQAASSGLPSLSEDLESGKLAFELALKSLGYKGRPDV